MLGATASIRIAKTAIMPITTSRDIPRSDRRSRLRISTASVVIVIVILLRRRSLAGLVGTLWNICRNTRVLLHVRILLLVDVWIVREAASKIISRPIGCGSGSRRRIYKRQPVFKAEIYILKYCF